MLSRQSRHCRLAWTLAHHGTPHAKLHRQAPNVDANRLKDVGGQPLSEIRAQNLDGGAVEPLLAALPMGELGGGERAAAKQV